MCISSGNIDQNCPSWSGTISYCTSYLTSGGPGKEWGTNKLTPTRKIRERSKGARDTSTYDSKSPQILLDGIHLGWDMHTEPERTLSQNDWPETTSPITIKPETVSHMAEKSCWVPLPCCSLPGCSFPIKPLVSSVHMSPRIIHFQVLDKSLLLGQFISGC